MTSPSLSDAAYGVEREPVRPAGSPPAGETLRERLVDAAVAILGREGIEALSLRSVARRTGVSHGAPARHFRSLSDLRAEVAAVGFRLLSQAIEDANAASPPNPDPVDALRAAGRAYVDCAMAHPGLFTLMFRADDLDETNASLMRDSLAAFEKLLDHVSAAQSVGWQVSRDARLLAASLWASVHGLATLWVSGAYQQVNPKASLDEAIAATFALADASRTGDRT